MFSVITCITTEHDLSLLGAALFICVSSSFAAFRFHALAGRSYGRPQKIWLCLAGLVGGAGVWATHFLSMLAYSPALPIRYALLPTAASLALAILGLGAGFALAVRGRGLRSCLEAGAAAGLGIVAMHYVGVEAIRSVTAPTWDTAYVAASVVLAMAGAVGAFAAHQTKGVVLWIGPTALMTLGIVGLHFTAMTGLRVTPDLSGAVFADLDNSQLGYLVGGVTGLLLSAALAVIVLEAQSRRVGLGAIEASFQEVPTGFALFDPRLHLLTWNRAYAKMVGRYGIGLAAGMSLMAIVRQGADSGLFPEAVAQEADWTTTFIRQRLAGDAGEYQFPDGRWLRLERCLVKGGGYTSILNDVSDQVAAEFALVEARDRAEAANRAKSDFLANISHEIRTPLNGVFGMVQAMEADELSEAQHDRLKVLRQSGESLLAILNDLLDLSKAQAGKLDLHVEDVEVDSLSKACCAAFRDAAQDKGLELSIIVEDSARGFWRTDPQRLRQVLSNLLANSLKFTHVGGVAVRIRRDGEGLSLAVTDTGIGIEPDQIPRLFEKFTQADASTTRIYGGTGLGLSICRELVDLMGGAIDASSHPGVGSCFTVKLPLARGVEPAAPAALVQHKPLGDERVIRVLAAEDNKTNQVVLRALLAPLGVELVIVENGRTAVEAIQQEYFDVVLMDIQMPEMNGVEATRQIRAWQAANGQARVPIYALSANVMIQQVAEYLSADMDGCVAKPIEVDKLYAAIEAALQAVPTPITKAA